MQSEDIFHPYSEDQKEEHAGQTGNVHRKTECRSENMHRIILPKEKNISRDQPVYETGME